MIHDSAPSIDQAQSDPRTVAGHPTGLTAEIHTAPQTQPSSAPIVFPWLWLWLVTYFLQIPSIFSNFIIPHLRSIFFGDEGSAARPLFTEFSVRGVSVVELVPFLIVMLGVLSLLFPKQRAAHLERKYKLKNLGPEQLPEIGTFLGWYAPKLNIKVNLAQMNQYAFVYPTGYRSFAIAIFGPLARLWRQDPEAAKAVLLHEVAHYRSGDGHIQGTGSLFTWYLRSWLLILLLSLILPFVLNLIDALATAVMGMFQEGYASSIPNFLILMVGSILTHFVPSVMGTAISAFLGTLSIIFLPLMGIWIAEMNADFYAAQMLGDTGAVQRALRHVGQHPSFFIWLLRRMTHPPELIRRAVLRVRNRQLILSILLLLMPLAYLARLLIILAESMVMILVQSIFLTAGANGAAPSIILYAFGQGMWQLSGILVVAVFLLMLWCWLAPRWQSIFIHVQDGVIAQKLPYFIAAGLTFGLVSLLAFFGVLLQCIFG